MVGAAIFGATAICAVATLIVRHRMCSYRRWSRVLAIARELEEKCATPDSKLKQVADAMTVEMHAGLASEGGSKLKMLISYVDNLPTGFVPFFPFFSCGEREGGREVMFLYWEIFMYSNERILILICILFQFYLHHIVLILPLNNVLSLCS